MKNLLYRIYVCVIAFPIILLITALVCVLVIFLFPFANHSVAYVPTRIWSKSICALFLIKVKVSGLENIPQSTSCIYACNHQSMLDVFLMHGWLPGVFKWVMRSNLRKIPLVGAACKAGGHVFIDSASQKSKRHMLEDVREQLQNGISVVIFPEGTRTKDGSIGRFKRGAFTLATELQLPVVPVTIKGAFECMPRNRAVINYGTVHVTFHPLIRTENYNSENCNELITQCRNVVLSAM